MLLTLLTTDHRPLITIHLPCSEEVKVMDTFEKIKEIIVEELALEPEEVTMDATFDDLGADSLDIVEIVMALEDEFDVEIPDEDAEEIQTVEDAVNYIEDLV